MTGGLLSSMVSLTIALTFLASAIGKTRDLAVFESSIEQFRILPSPLVRPTLWLVLGSEYAVVGLTLLGEPSGLILALALLLAFSVVITLSLWRRLDVSCSCFGPSPQKVAWADVVRNTLLILIVVTGLVAQGPAGALSFGEHAILLFPSAVLAAVVGSVRDIADFFSLSLPVDRGGPHE